MAVASPEHEARDAWTHVLDRAREELPETTVVMWFADVRPVSLAEGSITLAVPSPLVRERLQHNHLPLIERAAQEAAGRPLTIELSTRPSANRAPGRSSRPIDRPTGLRFVRHDRRPERRRPRGIARRQVSLPELHVRRLRARTQ
jgi:chromosomal replication initiation ATPase DnaA